MQRHILVSVIHRRAAMPNHVRHFAIHADQVDRARAFYETVFGWRFEPWGSPNFYLIRTGPDADRGLQGALQERNQSLAGTGMRGFECTIGVDDLDAVLAAIPRANGSVVSTPFTIEGVGRLAFFEDTEGNRVGAMQYGPATRSERLRLPACRQQRTGCSRPNHGVCSCRRKGRGSTEADTRPRGCRSAAAPVWLKKPRSLLAEKRE